MTISMSGLLLRRQTERWILRAAFGSLLWGLVAQTLLKLRALPQTVKCLIATPLEYSNSHYIQPVMTGNSSLRRAIYSGTWVPKNATENLRLARLPLR